MFAMACACTATDSVIINADEQAIPVSPKFYGIFFEEINMAGHGGIYAELIRNRNFEDSNKPDHWTAYSLGGALAKISIVNDVPTGAFNFLLREKAGLCFSVLPACRACYRELSHLMSPLISPLFPCSQVHIPVIEPVFRFAFFQLLMQLNSDRFRREADMLPAFFVYKERRSNVI